MGDSDSSDTDNATPFVPHFLNKIYENIPKEENVVSSPLGIEIVLAMLHQGTSGETADVFAEILNVANKNESGKKFKNMLETLNSLTDVTLDMANKIFIMDGFIIKDTFKNALQEFFMSRADEINFAKSAKAASKINQWVKNKTNDKIKDLIPASSVNALTRLVLVNAIYFKGFWENPFREEDTTTEPFFVSDEETMDCAMMFISEDFNFCSYCSKLEAALIEIPYKNDNGSMIIILPEDYDGIDKLESDLANVDISKVMKQGYVQQVEFSLPKFRIETELDLVPVLEKMGLEDIFTPNSHADFSEICKNSDGLCVSKFVQKAFIEVNEKGTEAAAASGGGLMMLSGPERFVVNHPFIFVLQARGENDSNTVLFVGKVLRPKY